MLNIRKLDKNDYGPYSSLFEEIYSKSFAIDIFFDYLFKIESNNTTHTFILENGNNIVASIKIMYEPTLLNEKKSICYITELIVSKKYGNEDYKTLLLDYVRDYSKNRCDKLIMNLNN